MPDYSFLENILVEIADKVATVTLNRPESLNAINQATHVEFEHLMLELDTDPGINAVVLTGQAGPSVPAAT